MKPHRVVEAGQKQLIMERFHAMRQQEGCDQPVIRQVGKDRTMQIGQIRQPTNSA